MKTYSMKRPLDEEDSLCTLETSSLSGDESALTSEFVRDSTDISQISEFSESEMPKKPFFHNGIDEPFREAVSFVQLNYKLITINCVAEKLSVN